MQIRLFFLSLVLFFISPYCAQDIQYARSVVNTLCAPEYHGRGYVNNGDKLAALYIENEFKTLGLLPISEKYNQPFEFSVNTFPNAMFVSIDGKPLTPGEDYIVSPNSGSLSGTYPISLLTKKQMNRLGRIQKFWKLPIDSTIVFIDKTGVNKTASYFHQFITKYGPDKGKGIVTINDTKLIHSVSSEAVNFLSLQIKRSALPRKPSLLSVDIENILEPHHVSQNSIGQIKGTLYPDSILIISAHYDHLGKMGKDTYFPGANDNASGIAMLLNLAMYFATSPPDYTLVFIAFGGEEIGLLGSKYFIENPLFSLDKISFVVNLDILGTGDEGITVVNGTECLSHFNRLKQINDSLNYLPEIKLRGKAANSDHHWFAEKKIPSVFIYTMGGIKAYHDIYDRPETLPLTEFEDVFKLLRDFVVGFR